MISEFAQKNKEKYLQEAFEGEISKVKNAPQGGRNNQLNTSAFNLGQLISHGLNIYDVENALLGACEINGSLHNDGEASCLATIKSGLSSGQRQPRGISDFDDNNVSVYNTSDLDNIRRSWEEGLIEGSHLYLENKKISNLHGAKLGHWFDKGIKSSSLMVPVRGFCDNTLYAIQHIYYDDEGKCQKRFQGKYKDHNGVFLFGKPEKIIAIAEGFATGASLFETTGTPVAVAFTASRLKTLAILLRKQYPKAEIVIISDLSKSEREKAEAASKAIGGKVFVPTLPAESIISEGEVFNDANDLFRLFGAKELSRQWKSFLENTQEVLKGWALAQSIAPRIDFPWNVLPDQFAQSLQQLGRSCATSDQSLPGMAFVALTTALGRKVEVQTKAEWREPLILWVIDIRETGEGKTPTMRALTDTLEQKQVEEHKQYKSELVFWETLPKEERHSPPMLPRGYFTTDFTFEGLQSELEDHPTGGILVLLNEASAIISSQNQYKKGGTDREALLALHDGHMARVVRKGKSIMIPKAGVQIAGGIQPKIFKDVFGGNDCKYLFDGTIFRCLYTYIPTQHFELTAESWNDEYREKWNNTLLRSLAWANEQEKTHILNLDISAQDRFFQWRNNLDYQKTLLPEELRGFLPKIYGYALRLTGAIHCLCSFHNNELPKQTLSLPDIEKGIRAAMFYLGQAVGAIKLLRGQELKNDPAQQAVLKTLNTESSLTRTQISDTVFQHHKPASEIQTTLDSLVEKNLISEKKTKTTGRSKTSYCLVREKSEKSEERLGTPPAIGLNSLNSLNSECITEEKDEGFII